MISESVGLSRRQRALLADWERARKKSVSFEEIARAVGGPPSRMVASTLVRKGVLDRLRPGLYAVRPFRAVARRGTLPSLVAVELLLDDAPLAIAATIRQACRQPATAGCERSLTAPHTLRTPPA